MEKPVFDISERITSLSSDVRPFPVSEIAGRLANYILKDHPCAYHVFISADAAAEVARVAECDHISADAAAAKVKKVNHERAVHCKHFTKTDWGNVKNYDLCIKSDDFGVEDTAKIIRELFQKKMGV